MTKKLKRSPYQDSKDSIAALTKPAKLPRSSQQHAKRTAFSFGEASSFGRRSANSHEDQASMDGHPSPVDRMSVETLEQKKMLLPYLEKIEYINVQLRQRGLLPDEGNATASGGRPAVVVAAPESRSELMVGASKPRGKPPLKSPTKTHAASIVEANVDPALRNKTGNQEGASGPFSPHTVTRQHSENQLLSVEEASAPKRPKIATETLRLRYPRLFASIDRARLTTIAPRLRPINWLLHLVEAIYDELTESFILGLNIGPAARESSPYPKRFDQVEPTPPTRLFQPRLIMPYLVRKHIDTTLGLPYLADQECLDLMYNMEATLESFAPVAMFSMFVREIYDDDTLLFFLFVRHILQREFDIQLKSKTKLAHSSVTGKKFISGDMLHIVPHQLVPDGSKTVFLTREGCEQLWRRYFTHASSLRMDVVDLIGNRTPASPAVLGQFITAQNMDILFNAQDEVAADHLLVWSVDAFRNISEDVIAQFKYRDDGESLRGLLRLRETISSDAKIGKLTVLYSECERALRSMKIDVMKLERSNNEDNKHRTQLRLLRNQISLLVQELEHIQGQISISENLVNDVWQHVTTTSPTKARKSSSRLVREESRGEFANGVKELPSVIGRFVAHISRLQRKHDIEVQTASMLAKPWKKQMEELQLRMVIKIQRAYRARQRAKEIKQKAREELHEKIRRREIQKQNEFLDRKRHEALQEKDMQRHQERMTAKQQHENAARDAVQQKQQQLLDKMRHEHIVQKDLERNAKIRRRLWLQWVAFVGTRKKKRQARRLYLKVQFMRWRHHFAQYKHGDGAARLLQRVYRRSQEKLRMRKIVQMNKKRNATAKKYLQKIQGQHVHRVFNKWQEWSTERCRLKANFETILQRRITDWYNRWVSFTKASKQQRLDAVILVQRVYRGRLARQVLRTHRKRTFGAVQLQRLFRGYRGRLVAKLRRTVKKRQDAGSQSLLQRNQGRWLYTCLARWCWLTIRTKHIKQMEKRRQKHLMEDGFDGFASYRQHRREMRAALLRKQFDGAILIQRQYRRHRCQVTFRVFLEHHRAAVKIQRVYRGYKGREQVRKLRWEIAAARTLQTIWRQRQARRLAEKNRAEAILLVAYKGDFTATQRAITMGFGHVVDEECNSILHMAAAAGHKRLIKLCLRHQMDINGVNLHGQTPLHLLLTNLPPRLRDLDEDDDTRRSVEDRVSLAAYMIDHNAWHEAPDELGLTPLLLSSALGLTEATEMLLEKSADTEARSLAGLNAAQLCVEGSHAQSLRVLLASQGFNTTSNAHDTLRLLHACAGRGLIDCLRVLVEHLSVYELSPNQLDLRDDDGYTPLIYAISNANVDAVRCLLESGANPDEKDYFGRSPLHFAVCVGDHGLPAVVELLVVYDVDVNVKDTDGDSALHVCCDRDARLGCISLLLRSGAAIGANTLGNHPTHIAARQGAVETLKLLVEYGADMNMKNYDGKTPLGMARMLGQKTVVQYIQQYFAAEPIAQAHNSDENADRDDAAQESDQVDEEHPQRSPDQWRIALNSAFRLGSLAEWTHYIDAETESSFYACPSPENDTIMHCTWESPIEFDAAMGDIWEVMRSGASGVASRSNVHGQDLVGKINNGGAVDESSLQPRAGQGVHYLYHNRHTGEVRSTVPPIDYSLLQDVVQNSKRHQQLRQKIRKVSADTSASAMEYMRFFHEFEAEAAQTRAELSAVVTIQRHFRARRTKRMVRLLLFQNKCAILLQRTFRGREARKLAASRRHEYVRATTIQALWRGHATRNRERESLHAERAKHRFRRQSALRIQRLFRGHCGRLLAHRERVIQKHGPKGYVAWEQFRRCAIVKQSYKVWDEMELPDKFPGVFFYCHEVTRLCAWEKPKEWQAHDLAVFQERCQLVKWGYSQQMKQAAIRLQGLWRSRQARIAFRLIMKAVRLMKTSEQDYLEDPTNLVKMGNYVLFLHAILHDYERARPLYGRLMRTMAQRGPDVPFILFSYGIFLYVTQEDDVALVEDMIMRAKLLDRQMIKYKLAFLGFFRQSMLQNPDDGESNLNFAACLQWLFDQYDESVPFYLRAIAANPHKKGSMELFQDMLNRKKQVDKVKNPSLFAKPTGKFGRRTGEEEEELQASYDGYELFRRWQIEQAEEDDRSRRKQFEAEQDARNRLEAALRIQARYRRRHAVRTANRAKAKRQVALSMADLADTKPVYDSVRLAFDKVGEAIAPTGIISKLNFPKAKRDAPSKTMSIPISRVEELFAAMDLSLSAEEFHDTVTAFREQHGKAPNVNVTDVTSFAQSNPVVAFKLKEKKQYKKENKSNG